MHSAATNRRQSRLKISECGPKRGSTRPAAATMCGALTLAVLSALLLIAANPAQAQTEAVPYSFAGNPDGANPESSLTYNGGNFYGTTVNGGLNNDGTVFQLVSNGSGGWTETTPPIYTFCSLANCADGQNPTYGTVTFDSNGNLYGTTLSGGANGYGVVYELSPPASGQTAWTETVLYSFANNPDGANPVNGLIWDASGNLYGVTYNGGVNGNGTIFELTPSSGTWSEQVLYDYNATYAGLTINTAGDIFVPQYGSVLELKPNGSGGYVKSTIFSFSNATKDGSVPNGTLALDSAGNLYGTTIDGGAYGYGTVYKLTAPTKSGAAWTEKLLTSLASGANEYPLGGVVLDSNGNVYGTASASGKYNDGAVFELVAPTGTSTTYTKKMLFTFDGETGNEPYDTMTLVNGYLYGTTYIGGTNGDGAVFQINPAATVTTTTLTSSANPSTSGESVTFTATVTPAPPNGEVVVFEPLGQTPMTNGVATYTTSTLPVGTTKVRAVYEGDINFITSMSGWLSQVVDK
jgi:uncharacterized repeat protein (TIGR03803 family)